MKGGFERFGILSCALACVLLVGRAALAAPPEVRRVAVLVGANDPPPGRSPLRYAHEDARQMAEVLTRVGSFAPADVHVLLEPDKIDIDRVLASVAQTARPAASDTVFVFYYSGHSDGQAVYPKGTAVSLADLRAQIAAVGARVTLGILDTCRGGAWTRAKGLTVGPPLETVDLVALTSEGTALLSSSSGLESAHEAEAIRGSFFTHHLVGGLLGGADRNADGLVTLDEAFEYAKNNTIRDSARMAATVQHPSFDVQLRGRQDLVMAQLTKSSSSLEVLQSRGPLEVIQLASGVTVSELAPGARRVRLALAPGRYIVRKVADGKTFAKDVDIGPSSSASIAEEKLELAPDRLALKGGDNPPVTTATTLPKGWWELRLGAGVSAGPVTEVGSTLQETTPRTLDDGTLERKFVPLSSLTWGITDRLSWSLIGPAFAYRIGDRDSFEVVPRAGLVSIGFADRLGLFGSFDAGVALRLPASPTQAFILSMQGRSQFSIHTAEGQEPAQGPTLWRFGSSLGYTWLVQNQVSLAFGGAVAGDVLFDASDASARKSPTTLAFGSVLSLGYRSIPLVQVHLSERFSLDAYATWSVPVKGGGLRDTYLAGFTWNF